MTSHELSRELVATSQLEADFLHPGHHVTWLPKVACQTDHSLKQGAVALFGPVGLVLF